MKEDAQEVLVALTIGGGPLAARSPETVNYRIDGPGHRLFWHDFPRRVRALFGDQAVLDTREAKLLHESNLLPQLYVPVSDMREDLLVPSSHTTHCPFKGEASYYSVWVGDRVAENAVWSYPTPIERTPWLAGYMAVYWQSMDAWFDEDEEVFGHLRDPYHRMDIRNTSQLIRVVAGDVVVAETRRAKLLSETGLPNRYYVPRDEVRTDLLEPSATHTVCPYKGSASYRALRVADVLIADAAWFYPAPLDGAQAITGHFCFVAEDVHTWADGHQVA